jgi:hypothetical protein
VRYHRFVGYYLWLDGELAWAQGTYEYRPVGTAVISSSDLFRRRDFSPRRPVRPPVTAVFEGQFASLGHLNQQLRTRRRAQRKARDNSAAAP